MGPYARHAVPDRVEQLDIVVSEFQSARLAHQNELGTFRQRKP
ncbi:hypothetical protein [Nocardia sp. NPDC049526]